MQLLLQLTGGLHVCPQALVCDVLQDEYNNTVTSSALQPYLDAPELLQLCSMFNAESYLACRPSARQVQSDVDTLGSWLFRLSASGHHISVPCNIHASGGLGLNDSQLCSASASAVRCTTDMSSSNVGVDSGRMATASARRGLLEIDVSSVRPVLLKAGQAAFRWVEASKSQAGASCAHYTAAGANCTCSVHHWAWSPCRMRNSAAERLLLRDASAACSMFHVPCCVSATRY